MRARFVPTGHADLDQLRQDGVAGCAPWWVTTAAGLAAGLSLVIAVPLLYLGFALFEAAITVWQLDGAAARDGLLESLGLVAQYGRFGWLSGLAVGSVGCLYALLRRWAVLRVRYVRVGPWEVGAHTLFAAAAGYAAFFTAARLWPPLAPINAWLFWAWGPVFAWILGRLQDIYLLWIVRPGWQLEVEATVRALIPRRFGCPEQSLRVEADPASRTVAVTAEIDAGEASRVRELIQAIPETASVIVNALGRRRKEADGETKEAAGPWRRARLSDER